MLKVNKILIAATTAVLAVGFVAVTDIAQSRHSNPAAVVEARFPSANEAWPTLMPAAETPAKPASASCSREHWPYVSEECLQGNGNRKPARTIPLERRIATAAPAISL